MCDACEHSPCLITLKKDVTDLLSELDELAREEESGEYGLPLGALGIGEEMEQAVYRFLAKYRPEINLEESVLNPPVSKNIYVTVSTSAFYDVLREDAEGEGSTNWTVNPNVRRGDLIPLYIGKPISAIVAVGEASNNPVKEEDVNETWYGHHFVDIHNLRMLEVPITRAQLMSELPDWGWPRQPRSFVCVPKHFHERLKGMLEGAQDK